MRWQSPVNVRHLQSFYRRRGGFLNVSFYCLKWRESARLLRQIQDEKSIRGKIAHHQT